MAIRHKYLVAVANFVVIVAAVPINVCRPLRDPHYFTGVLLCLLSI